MRLAVVAEADVAGAVQHLEIRERVLFEHREVGELTGLDGADAVGGAERLRAVQCRGAQHFERMEARLAQQLQLLDRAEAVQLIDESRVRADRDAAAAILVVVHERHPQVVVLAPRDFVLAAPVEEEAAVVVAVRRVEIPQLRQRVFLVPVGASRAHQIA